MGYLTRHSLRILDENGEEESAEISTKIIKELIEFYELEYALSENGEAGESCKWYSHHQDMLLFSKKFPDVVFELHGEGEETGDLWNEYFKNGKSQIERAKIVIGTYDSSKLS
jgi:hypothetical protein